ncbi:MAG: biosynthetic-type acetolactate synthase large subunit [Gemmatimonadota bacterium]
MTELRTGAQIICEALVREGVDVIFGIPGGAIMPFYHALPEYPLRHVLCRHEQGAGHAAEGYARASGRVGVCVATSGPGSTNLVTPIANAWMDSTPLVAITGQVSSTVMGTDAFQETDIIGITMPITKHSFLVTRAAEIPAAIHAAFHLAGTGRCGPVLVDITKDAQQELATPVWEASPDVAGYRTNPPVDMDAVRTAARLLEQAERPLILAGNGVIAAGAHEELRRLAELTGIPVITTLHGKGAFPEDHPLALGMAGMHGWVHVNRAIQQCDVLLNVGGRFDDRVTGRASTFAPQAQIIHVDIDQSEIGKVVRVDVPIVADARVALTHIIEETGRVDTSAWLCAIGDLRAKHEPRQTYRKRPDTTALMPHDVYAALDATTRARGAYRIITDVGQHQMWAAQLIEWRSPRTHITSGGAGTMGFSVPAALGAALACPDETIWVICGDGGFQMTNQELATLMQEDIRNVKIAIINNGYLGMVRQWQELFEGRRYSGTPLSAPDFSLLARAYGLEAMQVDRIEDVDDAVARAWDHDGCVVIDFRVEREANVFPIVPQGRSIGEMMMDTTALPTTHS